MTLLTVGITDSPGINVETNHVPPGGSMTLPYKRGCKETMLIKNQIYETVITDYTAEGQGVAHIEGCAVFIPNAVAGERVLVRIEKAQKTWAAGKMTQILERSPHRINRECPVAAISGTWITRKRPG